MSPRPQFFPPDSQYLTCRMQNCTEANRNKPFPGYIDPDSLIVQDDYVFVQVWKIHFYWLSQRHFPISVLNAVPFAASSPLRRRKKKKNIVFFNKRNITKCRSFYLNRLSISSSGQCLEDLINRASRLHGGTPTWVLRLFPDEAQFHFSTSFASLRNSPLSWGGLSRYVSLFLSGGWSASQPLPWYPP